MGIADEMRALLAKQATDDGEDAEAPDADDRADTDTDDTAVAPVAETGAIEPIVATLTREPSNGTRKRSLFKQDGDVLVNVYVPEDLTADNVIGYEAILVPVLATE